jgi:hypothetical protein
MKYKIRNLSPLSYNFKAIVQPYLNHKVRISNASFNYVIITLLHNQKLNLILQTFIVLLGLYASASFYI